MRHPSHLRQSQRPRTSDKRATQRSLTVRRLATCERVSGASPSSAIQLRYIFTCRQTQGWCATPQLYLASFGRISRCSAQHPRGAVEHTVAGHRQLRPRATQAVFQGQTKTQTPSAGERHACACACVTRECVLMALLPSSDEVGMTPSTVLLPTQQNLSSLVRSSVWWCSTRRPTPWHH